MSLKQSKRREKPARSCSAASARPLNSAYLAILDAATDFFPVALQQVWRVL